MKVDKRAAAMTLMTLIAVGLGLRDVKADGIPDQDPLYYSGFLTDNGLPVVGTAAITIDIWPDATSAAMPLCQTVAPAAPVNQGRFRIALASACKTAVSTNKNVWVEVIYGTMSLGRAKVGAVPYAVEAERAGAPTGLLAQQVVPPGAVMAFDLDGCPPGWSVLSTASGRTIIGANPNASNGLSIRTRGQTVGEEAHVLTGAETPSHTHDFPVYGSVGTFSNGDTGLRAIGGSSVATTFGTSQPTRSAGGDQPHNNMQPSLVLLYCKKN
jgi:hypothetical protein